MPRAALGLRLTTIGILALALPAGGAIQPGISALVYTPPACQSALFDDVGQLDPFCPWIGQLVYDQVSAGCSLGSYCPAGPLTRPRYSIPARSSASGD